MKGEIIYTVGLPGSGKSTWAKAYALDLQAQGLSVVRIELDEMREEYGVSPDNHEIEAFDELLAERERRVNHYLDNGYVVILSDTNLSPKAIEYINQLSVQDNVLMVTRKSFMHVPLSICIERDMERKIRGERYVGEKVIRQMSSMIST